MDSTEGPNGSHRLPPAAGLGILENKNSLARNGPPWFAHDVLLVKNGYASRRAEAKVICIEKGGRKNSGRLPGSCLHFVRLLAISGLDPTPTCIDERLTKYFISVFVCPQGTVYIAVCYMCQGNCCRLDTCASCQRCLRLKRQLSNSSVRLWG